MNTLVAARAPLATLLSIYSTPYYHPSCHCSSDDAIAHLIEIESPLSALLPPVTAQPSHTSVYHSIVSGLIC